MTEITTSLDWAKVQQEIETTAKNTGKHAKDLLHISKNIGQLVSELSKEEINCRRQGKQTRRHKELLENINGEIENFEKMITFGSLLGE